MPLQAQPRPTLGAWKLGLLSEGSQTGERGQAFRPQHRLAIGWSVPRRRHTLREGQKGSQEGLAVTHQQLLPAPRPFGAPGRAPYHPSQPPHPPNSSGDRVPVAPPWPGGPVFLGNSRQRVWWTSCRFPLQIPPPLESTSVREVAPRGTLRLPSSCCSCTDTPTVPGHTPCALLSASCLLPCGCSREETYRGEAFTS